MKSYRYRKTKSTGGLGDPGINLTPLIDVVFVILVMFIIVAPLLELDEVQLASGSAKDAPAYQPEASSLHIHVKEDNSIWINKQRIPSSELPPLLQKIHERIPGERPQVFHDRRAQFGTYQTVKNALEEAGFSEMDIILSPS